MRNVWGQLGFGCMRDCGLNVKLGTLGSEESGQFLSRGVAGEFA